MPNKTKTYRELKEWVGLNYPDNDTGRAVQAVDDVDTAAFSVETPDVLEKLNVLLSSLCQKQVINPYYIINDIWKKLSIVGLNFDMRAITFVGGQGRVTVPVTQYGGRYGALSTSTGHSSAPGSVGSNPASFVSSDDGTRLPGGLNLTITFQKNGGIYTLDARLERGGAGPFIESAASVKEAVEHPYTVHIIGSKPIGFHNEEKAHSHAKELAVKHQVPVDVRDHIDMRKGPKGMEPHSVRYAAGYGTDFQEARMPKPKEPVTANMSHEERVRAGLNHAKAKIAYWQNIIKDHRAKNENTARAEKYLKRAESSLGIMMMHQRDIDAKTSSVKEATSATEALPTSKKNWPYHKVLHQHGFEHVGSNHPQYNEYGHEKHTYVKRGTGKNHIGIDITHGKDATSVGVKHGSNKSIFVHSPEELHSHLNGK